MELPHLGYWKGRELQGCDLPGDHATSPGNLPASARNDMEALKRRALALVEEWIRDPSDRKMFTDLIDSMRQAQTLETVIGLFNSNRTNFPATLAKLYPAIIRGAANASDWTTVSNALEVLSENLELIAKDAEFLVTMKQLLTNPEYMRSPSSKEGLLEATRAIMEQQNAEGEVEYCDILMNAFGIAEDYYTAYQVISSVVDHCTNPVPRLVKMSEVDKAVFQGAKEMRLRALIPDAIRLALSSASIADRKQGICCLETLTKDSDEHVKEEARWALQQLL